MTAILAILLILVVGGSLYYFSQQRVSDNSSSQISNPAATPKEVPKNLGPLASTASTTFDDPKLLQLKKDILLEVDQKISTLSGKSTTTTTATKSTKEEYVYFGTTGSTQSITWIDLAGSSIKFNIGNYPGAKAFYFQASLQTDAPDRIGYARVYDTTHSAPVGGSDINFTGLTATFKQSSTMNLSSGDLDLKVQLQSTLNLTTIYNPRIKIVY